MSSALALVMKEKCLAFNLDSETRPHNIPAVDGDDDDDDDDADAYVAYTYRMKVLGLDLDQ